MKYIHMKLSGQLPENHEQALDLLKNDLGLAAGTTGIEIRCHQGEEISVVSDGISVELGYVTPVSFYRALSLIPQPPDRLRHPRNAPV